MWSYLQKNKTKKYYCPMVLQLIMTLYDERCTLLIISQSQNGIYSKIRVMYALFPTGYVTSVNSALCCTQRERDRDGNSNCDRERKRREEDLPPRSLPSNSLVNFISFYWLIFNTIYFILFLFWLCELFYYSRSFCHGDGYKHTPNWQVPTKILLLVLYYIYLDIIGKLLY